MKRVQLVVFSFLLLLGVTVQSDLTFASENDSLEEKLMQWDEQGIDPNHTEVINRMKNYIDENLSERFASLHIDRDESDLGVIVLSFTELPDEAHEQALEDMLDENASLKIRQVDYTEEELIAKQREIDLLAYEQQGISIHFTSVDVIGNQVEVGISPYTEENVQTILNEHGSEMLSVVESAPISTLEGEVNEDVADEDLAHFSGMADDNAETVQLMDEAEVESADEEKKNFIQKFFATVQSWFSSIF